MKPTVLLRPATMADAATLFAWQQHPDTRKFARHPEPPSWEDHLEWMRSRIADMRAEDADHFVWVAERTIRRHRHPVGVVHLTGEEVSIVVAPGLRGRGIGTVMLRELIGIIADEAAGSAGAILKAYILPENQPSMWLFHKAGFLPVGNGWFQLKILPI